MTTGSVTITAVNNKVDASDNALTVGGTTAQNWVAITGASLTIKDEDILAKPTGVRMSVVTTKVRADWDATTGADGYKVQWDDDSDFGSLTDDADKTGGATTNHSVTSGLTNGTTYHFRVIATKAGYDDSAPSDSASATPNANITDYDADDDGLIDVDSLTKLNAIRWDLDGDGVGDKLDKNNDNDYVDAGEYDYTSQYKAAFSNPEANMGCGESAASISSINDTGNPTCKGYELTANLDFDTNSSGGPNAGDTYWNSGQGWLPIGATAGSDTARAYTGEFEGNGGTYTVSNLHVDRSGANTVGQGGLFAEIGAGGVVKNLALTGVSVTAATNATATAATDIYAGAIAGENAGSITGSYAIGTVKATQSDNTNTSPAVTEKNAYAGGLVGKNTGTITSSYARAAVTAEQLATTTNDLEAQAGGLVGIQEGSTSGVAASFSTGTVVADSRSSTGADAYAGGLVGHLHAGKIEASYSHAHPQAKTTASANTATLKVGGLVGDADSGGTVTASFSTGKPTTSGGSSPTENIGGLVGHKHASATITDSYWDTDTSGITATGAGTGKTTSELQTPTAYGTQSTDIYKDWDIDLDSVTTGTQDGWEFGTSSQYPALDYGLTAADQRASVTLAVNPATICETTKGTDANACGASPVTASTLTATISPAQEVPITLDISETATEYRLKSGSTYTTELVIAAGSTTGTLTVEAVNNTTDASDNDVTLTPATNHNWVAMPSTAASLTIEDDDFGLTAPVFTISTSLTPPYNTVTLRWTRQTGATGNKLEYKEANDSSWTTVSSVDPGGVFGYTISPVLHNGVYTFKLAATKTGYDDGPWSTQTASPGKDYDSDDDGLLEITTLAQLNAVRWDLDGNGNASSNQNNYKAAFSSARAGMGCNEDESDINDQICDGYELSANLDFNTNSSTPTADNPTGANSGDTYWNGGAGWNPIGGVSGATYTGKFDGNNYAITNLFINRTSGSYAGLFGYLHGGSDDYVKNLGLTNADVTLSVSAATDDVFVGALAGVSRTDISSVYATGEVNSDTGLTTANDDLYIGGLVGQIAAADIVSSYSWADVNADISDSTHADARVYAGGLAGEVSSAKVTASYAAGKVTADGDSREANSGGLTGNVTATSTIHSSYARGDVDSSADTDAKNSQGGLAGRHLGTITNSFYTGKLIGTHSGTECGLVGKSTSATITASYYDSSTIGKTGCATGNGTGKNTSQLQTPTAYGSGANDIYKDWNANIDGNAGDDDPWDFGTANQYPALKYGLTADDQRPQIVLTLSPETIYERVGGPTTSTVTATIASQIGWNRALDVSIPQEATRYTVGDATIAAGDRTGSATLTAVNNYTDASNYSEAITLVTHPAKISGTTTTDYWVSAGVGSAPTITIVDDDELAQVIGVTASQEDGGIRVNWTKATGATGYRLYWKSGSESYDDARHVTAGDVATHLIPESGSRFTPGATYTLMIQATKTGADYGKPSADATVAFKGWIVVSLTAIDVAEPLTGTTTGTYTVKLGTLPIQSVTVTITRKAGTHASRPTYSPTTLTFTSANGTTAQTVTVSVTPDLNDINTESTTLVHTAASTDTNFTSIPAPEVVARAVDGNAPPTSANVSYDVTPPYLYMDFRNFTFADADSNTYHSIIIETLPTGGRLRIHERRTGGPCNQKPSNPYCQRFTPVTAGMEIATAYTSPWNKFKLLLVDSFDSNFENTSFDFKVKDNTNAKSTTYTVTLKKSGLPDPPTAFAVTTDDGQATLSWTKPADPPGDPVTKHQVRWETYFLETLYEASPWTDVAIVQNQSDYTHTFTGLINQAAYYFRARAVNNAGGGPASGTAGNTRGIRVQPALAAPAGLTASPETGKVVLDWTDPNNTAITSYQYQTRTPNTQELQEVRWQAPSSSIISTITEWEYRKKLDTADWLTTGDMGWTDICLQSSDSTCKDRTSHRIQHSTLVSGSKYHVQIRYKVSSTATAVDIVSKTALVSTKASVTTATIEWVAASGATGYEYRTKKGSDAWSAWADAGTGTSKSLTGLTASTDYLVQVRATKANKEYLLADALADTSTLKASAGMRWPSAWTDISGSDDETIKHDVTTGLTEGVSNEFRIRARKGTGANTLNGNPSAGASLTLPSAVPAKPTGLEATPKHKSAALSWTNPNDSAIYKWQYSSDDGSTWSDVPNSGATTATYTVTGLTNGTAYTLKVRAANYKGNSPASDSVSATPVGVPAKPTGFSAIGQGTTCVNYCNDQDTTNDVKEGSVQLTWDNPSNTTITGWQYRVKWSVDPYGGWTNIPSSGATTASHTVDSLQRLATPYTFQIRAVNSAGNGAESDTASSTVLKRPGAPAISTATAGNRAVTLTWTAPSTNADAAKRYQYQYKTTGDYGAWQTWSEDTVSPTIVSALTGNVAHTFRIRALNTRGEPGAPSNEVAATPTGPPAAPTSLTAEAGNKTLRVSWTAPTGHVNPITGYEYRTKLASASWPATGAKGWTAISGSGAATTTADAAVAANGDQYDVQIRAVNADGKGAAASVSETAIAVPAIPTGLTANAYGTQADLTWTDPSDTSITKYEYSKDGGTNWTQICLTSSDSDCPTETSHTVGSLTRAETYTILLRAVNATGNGLSASVSAALTPARPAGI